ncbi:MAG: hypothetical protein HZA58_08440 [Acidimicrobiia bacterium]|nr:hypothetical protein [Acidimicrobiia bacterium]
MRFRSLPHLVRRFFGSLRARRPRPRDQIDIAAILHGEAARLFAAQRPMDQHHALRTARQVEIAAPHRPDLVRAALLHDVGKAHSDLGVVGRSLASLCALARIPTRGRFAAYLDHGRLGAADLAAAGESGIEVAFAAHHHVTESPAAIDPSDWALLRTADGE